MKLEAQTGSVADIDGSYAWIRLAISVLFGTLGGVGMWAIVVVMPTVQAEFGVDRADAALPYTAAMLGFAAGNVIIGWAIDRIGYWLPALVTGVLLGAGFILAALTTSILPFSIVHGLLIGIGTASSFGPLIADLSHWFNKRRGLAVSCAATGSYLAGVVWPAVIPGVMAAHGWRFAYIAIGIVCIVGMVPLALMLRRKAPRAALAGGQGTRPVRQLSLSPGRLQALLIISGIGCCVAMSMPQVHIVAYCMDLGYGVARGADMLSVMMAAGIVSRIGSGFIADRIGGVRTLMLGAVLQGLALLLYVPFNGLTSLYVVSLVFGLSQGGIVPCYAVIVREYMPAAEAGRRVGVVIMATILGMALGGWMSGWIYDLTGSYAAAFLNGIAWNCVTVSIALFLLWTDRRAAYAQA